MAMAAMAAANVSVTETCVLSTKKTRAVTERTAKETVKTVLRVTCDAGRTGSEVSIAPFYRSSRQQQPAMGRRRLARRPSMGRVGVFFRRDLPKPIDRDGEDDSVADRLNQADR